MAGARTRAGEAGFTLLEAIVAIALLAATLVPIYALFSTTLRSAFRISEANRMAEIEQNALDVMATVNPMERPTGRLDLGPYAVTWTSRLMLPDLDGAGYPRGMSLFRIGYYESTVTVVDPDKNMMVQFKLRQVGYHRVRQPLPPGLNFRPAS